MEKMGIRDTKYIIGRHYDKEHPHVHIAFNRVDITVEPSATETTVTAVNASARS